MLKIIGLEEKRDVTPIRDPEGGRIVELVPGRERSYLLITLWGRTFRLRVPFWVLTKLV